MDIQSKRARLQKGTTMDEIQYLINGIRSGEFEVCEEEETLQNGDIVHYPKSALDQRLDKISSHLDAIRSESETIQTHANLITRDINRLTRESEHIDQFMDDLEYDIDEFDMYNRENNILIIGLPENKNEDAIDTAVEFFCEMLNVNLERDAIVFAHRISSKRHLMLQFFHAEHKEQIIHARRKLKGSGIVIYEDLSPKRYDLLNRARNVDGVSAWTVRGRITAVQDYVKYHVDSMADVTKLQQHSTQSKSKILFRYKMI